MVGRRHRGRESLGKRRGGTNLTGILDALVRVSQHQLGSRRYPPGDIDGCFMLPFMDGLPSLPLLKIQIVAQLHGIGKIPGAPDKNVDRIGAHMMAEGISILAHTTRVIPIVIPNPGKMVRRFPSRIIGIGVFDAEICRVAFDELRNIQPR